MTVHTFNEDTDPPRKPFGEEFPIEIPQLLAGPEQKYVGTWEPGENQPTLPTLDTGPYAGIVRYLPIPESQIER